MRCRWPALVVLPLCAIIPMTAPASAQANLIIKQFIVDITVQPDGRYTRTFHMERSAANAATADRVGQYVIAFNPSLQRLDIPEAYTLKADDTRKLVQAGAIRAQLAPGVPNVPMFADVQQKVVVFPDVAVGDTDVMTTLSEADHPLFPGHITGMDALARLNPLADRAVRTIAP